MPELWLKKRSANESDEEWPLLWPLLWLEKTESYPEWRNVPICKFISIVSGNPAPAYLCFQAVALTVNNGWKQYVLDRTMFYQLFQSLTTAFVNAKVHFFFQYYGGDFENGSELLEYLDTTFLPLFKQCTQLDLVGGTTSTETE